MSGDLPASSLPIGTRVSFPYGGSRRTGVISDVSLMPDPNGSGSTTLAYLVDVGARKVFVQGDGIAPAGEGPLVTDGDSGPPQRRRGGGQRPRRRR
jgi:hypothetical protein